MNWLGEALPQYALRQLVFVIAITVLVTYFGTLLVGWLLWGG